MGNSIHHYRSNIIAPSSNNQHLEKPKNNTYLRKRFPVLVLLRNPFEVFQGPLADSGTPALKALLQLGGLRVGESWGSRCWGLQFYGFHWAWFFMRSADGVWWWWLPPWNSLKNSQVLNSYKVWLVGGFKYFLVCTPKIGEDEPILTIIFFR